MSQKHSGPSSQVALITGGAGGIGLAIARRLARDGANLVLVDARLDAVNAAAETLRSEGHRATGVQCDVSRTDEVDALVAATIAREKRIDVLVNNAGIMGRVAPLWELSVDEWNHVL